MNNIWLMEKIRELMQVGVSTGWPGSGMCLTRSGLNDIGLLERRPIANREIPQIKSDQTWLVGGWVG